MSIASPALMAPSQYGHRRRTVPLSGMPIYYFCLAFFIIDSVDVLNFLDFGVLSNALKYGYAVIVVGFMAVYFYRWRTITPSTPHIIFLTFFVLTGIAFALRFFLYGERQSYISAFISPLIFCLAMFIPSRTIVIDGQRIVRTLTLVFAVGTVFYLIEAIIKPLPAINDWTSLHEVQIHKSLTCVVALSLCVLSGRLVLGAFLAAVTIAALFLRPVSTMVLALAFCLPIALVLRYRVLRWGIVSVWFGRVLAMAALAVAIAIPLLLYFFWDDVAPLISFFEGSLKSNVIGGKSNIAFRLAILKFAFTAVDNTSFWYGSALAGSHSVALAQMPGFEWWWHTVGNEEAAIHSDFVTILVLMGIAGYVAFSLALYRILADRFHELKRRDLRRSAVMLQSVAAIATVALVIYCSDQPYLSYYNHTHTVWMLLFISEVARKSTKQ
jgi:hypothetical protein